MSDFQDYPKSAGSVAEIGIEEQELPGEFPGFSDVSDSVKESLKNILDLITKNDEAYRYRQLRGLKQNNLFWHGNTNVVWNGPNDLSGDWVSVAEALRSLGSDELKADPSLYDETVAVYRAYGESIVGAISTQPPSVRFFPDNADVIDDIRTASAYSRISKKIQQDNKVEVIMPNIVKLLCNEGLVAVYNYAQYDAKYGSVSRDVYGQSEVKVVNDYCPNCTALVNSNAEEVEEQAHDLTDGANLTNSEILKQPLSDEFGDDGLLQDPNEMPPGTQPTPQENIINCPECGYQGVSQSENYNETQAVKKDTKDIPKCRQIIETYGALQVQISQFADKPQDVGYLILYSEAHYAQMRDLFPWIREKIVAGSDEGNYYRWSRQYTGVYLDNLNQVTVRRMWIRPWMYEMINDEEKRAELKAAFPEGAYTVFVNEHFAQAFDEDLDEHWTLSLHPMSEKIYADPLLKFCVPIQRMVDDVTNLTLQTIKFGIPLIFADPAYFNFEKWSSTQALPGAVYPMKAAPGKGLGDSFSTVKTATLSREVDTFTERLNYYGQFVTGALPAIFGGASEGTLGQSDLNKQQALQRLGISWLVIKTLWATVMSKAVKQYATALLEDETITEQIGNSYINSVIRLEDLTGKVGNITAESSENFPITWGQKRQTIMELFGLQNEGVTQLLGSPENAGKIAQAVGLDELFIPGNDQRNKQLDEISQMIQGVPVPIEPSIDDDQIHIEACQAFICGEMGQDLKRFAPQAYELVLQHSLMHQQNLQMKMQAEMQAQQAVQQPQSKPEQFQ